MPFPAQTPDRLAQAWRLQLDQAQCRFGLRDLPDPRPEQPRRRAAESREDVVPGTGIAPARHAHVVPLMRAESPPLKDMQAPSEAAPAQPRVHVEAAADGLRVWLGLPGPAAHVQALLAETLPRLRRSLLEAGQPLAAVVCNGRPVGGPALPYQER